MTIETDVKIIRQIGLKMTDDDVEGFLKDLDYLFEELVSDMDSSLDVANVFSTLYKIWLEVKQDS